MGKGKNKTFKLKEYKVPHEKFVVVKNPWGLPEKIDGGTKLNEIGAWFALLMRKDYPNSRVREIYYQKTHRNIIVELPREVDVNKYLGAYRYADFHRNIPCEDSRSVYIYEYRYANFGNPGNKNWTGIIPSDDNIPAGLLQVLKDPFPLPSPAPPPTSDILYARPIPHDIQNILSSMRLITTSMEVSEATTSSAPAPNVGSSSLTQPSQATGSLFTPYEPPSHYVAHIEASKGRIDQKGKNAHGLEEVKKMDPYEEEEVEKSHLRSLSAVKDESNEAVDFLNSFLSNVKSEEVFPSLSRDPKSMSRPASTIDGEGDYKPSAELLDLFDTLDRKDVIVKSEVDDEDYRPSDELLAAFANLSDNTESAKRTPRTLRYISDVQVKPEPVDDDLNMSSSNQRDLRRSMLLPADKNSSRDPRKRPNEDYRPSDELLAAFANLSDNTESAKRTSSTLRYISDVQVKPEPVDDDFNMSSSNQRDPRRSMLLPGDGNSSRDPRKRPTHIALPMKHERSLEAEDEGPVLFRKRLKEY